MSALLDWLLAAIDRWLCRRAQRRRARERAGAVAHLDRTDAPEEGDAPGDQARRREALGKLWADLWMR
jgi:hypothetical protein